MLKHLDTWTKSCMKWTWRRHQCPRWVRAIQISWVGSWALCGVLYVPPVQAEERVSTLDRIARRGYVVIGHREGELPFSYLSKGHVTGYAHEICLHVIEGIRHQLNLPKLDIHYVAVTTVTRFILIENEGIDLDCGASTDTADRRQRVEFSLPYFVGAPRIVSLRQNNWQTLAQLHGRSVVVPTGSYSVDRLNRLARSGKHNIAVILTRSYQEAFDKVSKGHVAAMVGDEVLLFGLVASAADPARYTLSNNAICHTVPYAFMMPAGDPVLKSVVNRALRQLYESGEIHKIYQRWFQASIPPTGIQLDLPMSTALKTIFSHPTAYQE